MSDDPWDLDPDLPFHPYVACPHGGCKLPANHDAVSRLVDDLAGAKRLNTDLLAMLPVEDASKPMRADGPARSFVGYPASSDHEDIDEPLRLRDTGSGDRDAGVPRKENDRA